MFFGLNQGFSPGDASQCFPIYLGYVVPLAVVLGKIQTLPQACPLHPSSPSHFLPSGPFSHSLPLAPTLRYSLPQNSFSPMERFFSVRILVELPLRNTLVSAIVFPCRPSQISVVDLITHTPRLAFQLKDSGLRASLYPLNSPFPFEYPLEISLREYSEKQISLISF